MNRPNSKQVSMGIAVSVLVLLNVIYYGFGSEQSVAVHRQLSSVESLDLPPTLVQPRQYSFHRDIFNYLEVLDESSEPEVESEEPVAVEVPPVEPAGSVEAAPDFVAKGILKRNGRYAAILEYQGQVKVVQVGDHLDRQYVVEQISNSQVHVSTRKP